jgi:excisionase family DNA binding protein
MATNFLTVEQFGEKIKLHPGSVRRLIKEGRIFAARVGPGKKSPYRIAETELERLYLQSMCEKKQG